MNDCCKLGNGYGVTMYTIGLVTVSRSYCDECDGLLSESIYATHIAEDRLGWAGRVVAVHTHEFTAL